MTRPTRPTTLRSPAVLPFWLALAGACLEVLVVLAQHRAQPLRPMSGDVVWMAPLALIVVVALAVAPFLLFGRLARGAMGLTLALWVSASIVFMNLLMLVPPLQDYAAAMLAAGLAVQSTRLTLRHPDAVIRVIRATALALTACVALAGVTLWASHRKPAPTVDAAQARRPNLLFITLDTVRAMNMGLYGYARSTTPAIDRFAQRGVVFDVALSAAPWTLPSHASMFTGRWPHELSTGYESPLDRRYPTLAEYLADRGYATAGFVANLQYCGAATGLDRGFAHYEDYPRSIGEVASSSTLVRTVANNFRLRALIQNDQQIDRVTADDINARAIAWLSAHTDSPFFMFLNYFDAHEPYLPPPPFDRQFGSRERGRYSALHHWLWNPAVGHAQMEDRERKEEANAYDGAIAYVDSRVGALLDDLERRNILQNTVVVITADHGEELGEHGLYDHGYSLYRTALQVPLIIVSPGQTPAARRVATPVSLRDVAATMVDLMGIREATPFPGSSLAAQWRDHAAGALSQTATPSALFSEVERSPNQPDWFPSSKGDMQSVVNQGVHYIRNGAGSEELYDFNDDPWERQNLMSRSELEPAFQRARDELRRLVPPPSTRREGRAPRP